MSQKKSQGGFNQDLGKQFVPFWNGLIHLVGKVENGTILRRTGWNNIIRECEQFESDYLNSTGFCESCTFYNMPSFLQQTLDANPDLDCKTLAQDNDYLFLYCMEKKSSQTGLKSWKKWWVIGICLILSGLVVVMWWSFQKKIPFDNNKNVSNDLSKQFHTPPSVLFSKSKPLPPRNL